MWLTEIQNASAVCPERVRPEASVIVPDTIMGKFPPKSSQREDLPRSGIFRLVRFSFISLRLAAAYSSPLERLGEVFNSSKYKSIANNAAFALSVSKIVSTNKISAPPSTKPATCV